jgi:hypothetical protein
MISGELGGLAFAERPASRIPTAVGSVPSPSLIT